jgi:hypothetical protein
MSYDYSTMIGTAARLIDRFGRNVTRTRNVGGSVHPVTGAITVGTNTNTTWRGINEKIPLELIDGTRVLATDRMILLEAAASPLPEDKIDGWNIEEIEEIKPADNVIVWRVRIRK